MDSPSVGGAIDELLSVPHVHELIKHSTALLVLRQAMIGAMQVTPSDAVRLRRTYRRGLVIAIGLLAACFVAAPRRDGLSSMAEAVLQEPMIMAYWFVFIAAMGAGCLEVARSSFTFCRREAGPSVERTSFYLVGAGASLALIYVLHKAALLVLLHAQAAPAWLESSSSNTTKLILTVSLSMIVVGVLSPYYRSMQRTHRIRMRQQHRALRPLWEVVREAAPESVLARPPRGVEARLYRRSVEIRDGIRALLPYVPCVEDAVVQAGAAPEQQSALRAALQLEAARRRQLEGSPAAGSVPLERAHANEVDDLLAIAAAYPTAVHLLDMRQLQQR